MVFNTVAMIFGPVCLYKNAVLYFDSLLGHTCFSCLGGVSRVVFFWFCRRSNASSTLQCLVDAPMPRRRSTASSTLQCLADASLLRRRSLLAQPRFRDLISLISWLTLHYFAVSYHSSSFFSCSQRLHISDRQLKTPK